MRQAGAGNGKPSPPQTMNSLTAPGGSHTRERWSRGQRDAEWGLQGPGRKSPAAATDRRASDDTRSRVEDETRQSVHTRTRTAETLQSRAAKLLSCSAPPTRLFVLCRPPASPHRSSAAGEAAQKTCSPRAPPTLFSLSLLRLSRTYTPRDARSARVGIANNRLCNARDSKAEKKQPFSTPRWRNLICIADETRQQCDFYIRNQCDPFIFMEYIIHFRLGSPICPRIRLWRENGSSLKRALR